MWAGVLLFDGIYVYQSLDCKNGSFVGLVTSSDELASTVLYMLHDKINLFKLSRQAILPVKKFTISELTNKEFSGSKKIIKLTSKKSK